MKIIQEKILLNKGSFGNSKQMQKIKHQIHNAIFSIENPLGGGSFLLCDLKQGNGVKPIKTSFIDSLVADGWQKENRIAITNLKQNHPGPIDATYKIENKYFAVEWETGNISSSHRAVNKMVIGLLNGFLIGGALILPSRNMYYYLTDRVGNFKELEPYFDVWEKANYKIHTGFLVIIEIEHDGVSKNIKPIKKGTDGRALI